MLQYFSVRSATLGFLLGASSSQSPFSPLRYPTGLLSTVSTPPGSTAAAGFTPATIKLPSSTVLAPTLPPLLQTSTTSTISTTGIWAASYLLFFLQLD